MRLLVALLIILILAASLGAFVPRATAVSEGLLSVAGTRIVNPAGAPVFLRGVNYVGYESEDSSPVLHSESAYLLFAKVGFNVVRLPISWARLEPSPGKFNEQYLTTFVDNDVRWAKKYGLYVVLDMHQLYWGSRFGGSGIPEWLVNKYPATDEGMRRAVTDFWTQTAIQQHLVDVWTKIAHRYVNETTIAGYDILNEPWVYTSINPNLTASDVNSFYVRAIESIRSVDRNHIIFLEPSNMPPSEFPLKDKIVWSPHFYALSFAPNYDTSKANQLEADVAAKSQRFVADIGGPMWIGEFGAFMKDGTSEVWLRDSVRTFAKYEVGWAWWAFSGMGDRLPSPLYQTPSSSATSEGQQSTVDGMSVLLNLDVIGTLVIMSLVLVDLALLAGVLRRRRTR